MDLSVSHLIHLYKHTYKSVVMSSLEYTHISDNISISMLNVYVSLSGNRPLTNNNKGQVSTGAVIPVVHSKVSFLYLVNGGVQHDGHYSCYCSKHCPYMRHRHPHLEAERERET